LREQKISFFLEDIDCGGAEQAIVALAGEIARWWHAGDLVVAHDDGDF